MVNLSELVLICPIFFKMDVYGYLGDLFELLTGLKLGKFIVCSIRSETQADYFENFGN